MKKYNIFGINDTLKIDLEAKVDEETISPLNATLLQH